MMKRPREQQFSHEDGIPNQQQQQPFKDNLQNGNHLPGGGIRVSTKPEWDINFDSCEEMKTNDSCEDMNVTSNTCNGTFGTITNSFPIDHQVQEISAPPRQKQDEVFLNNKECNDDILTRPDITDWLKRYKHTDKDCKDAQEEKHADQLLLQPGECLQEEAKQDGITYPPCNDSLDGESVDINDDDAPVSDVYIPAYNVNDLGPLPDYSGEFNVGEGETYDANDADYMMGIDDVDIDVTENIADEEKVENCDFEECGCGKCTYFRSTKLPPNPFKSISKDEYLIFESFGDIRCHELRELGKSLEALTLISQMAAGCIITCDKCGLQQDVNYNSICGPYSDWRTLKWAREENLYTCSNCKE